MTTRTQGQHWGSLGECRARFVMTDVTHLTKTLHAVLLKQLSYQRREITSCASMKLCLHASMLAPGPLNTVGTVTICSLLRRLLPLSALMLTEAFIEDGLHTSLPHLWLNTNKLLTVCGNTFMPQHLLPDLEFGNYKPRSQQRTTSFIHPSFHPCSDPSIQSATHPDPPIPTSIPPSPPTIPTHAHPYSVRQGGCKFGERLSPV